MLKCRSKLVAGQAETGMGLLPGRVAEKSRDSIYILLSPEPKNRPEEKKKHGKRAA